MSPVWTEWLPGVWIVTADVIRQTSRKRGLRARITGRRVIDAARLPY